MLFVDEASTYRVLNRQIFLLIVLSVGAVGVYAFTKSMAAKEQQMDARIAAIRYRDGQLQLSSGQIDQAIDSFRKATTNALRDRTYALALANALAAGNHNAEAQQTLLRLREADPEDAEIDSQLARLSAKRGEVDDAVHYYQNALYGRWAGTQVDERKLQLRVELIRFLLAHQRRNIALSELLILEADLPRSAVAHVETARLFLQAGDAQHALKNYDAAIELDKDNLYALTEAGETAFRVGDYPRAEGYLRAAVKLNPKNENARRLLSVTEMVLSGDPLAPHLTMQEERERLLRGLTQASQRLQGYLGHLSDSREVSQLNALKEQALAMESELHSTHPLDSEQTKAGVELIYTIERATSTAGREPDDLDQALLLIGQKHSGTQP
jgi:tetratricopeptide (TPR) repeat protein